MRTTLAPTFRSLLPRGGASALALSLALSPCARAQAPRFPSQVELVRLDVVVVDSQGHPVIGLNAQDFEVKENGRPREIASFEPVVVAPPREAAPAIPEPGPEKVALQQTHDPREGRCVLIFFDDVHVSPAAASRVRSALEPFLEREVRGGDWVTLVAPQADVWWTARTAWERQQIPAIVARLNGQLNRYPWGSPRLKEYDAMQLVEYGSVTGAQAESRGASEGRSVSQDSPIPDVSPGDFSLAQELYEVACRRIRQTLGGLRLAVRSLMGFRGRKSLILYSEGFIRAPRVEAEELSSIIELARRANVSVYYVDAAGLLDEFSKNELQRSQGRSGSVHLALETGGRESSSNDPTAEVKRVLDESLAYYLIGFAPAGSRDGERKVEIGVRRPGLKVLARTRHVAPGPPASADPVLEAVAALRGVSDAADVPLRVALSFLDDEETGEVVPHVTDPRARQVAGARTALVRIEIGLPPQPAEQRFTLLAEMRPRDGGEPLADSASFVGQGAAGPIVVERRWRLAPGVWQSRVVVTHGAPSRLGSVLLTFEVGARAAGPDL